MNTIVGQGLATETTAKKRLIFFKLTTIPNSYGYVIGEHLGVLGCHEQQARVTKVTKVIDAMFRLYGCECCTLHAVYKIEI